MKKAAFAVVFVAFVLGSLPAQISKLPDTILPLPLLNEVIQEVSGEAAFRNLVAIAGFNRTRPAEEYSGGYFETAYVLKKLKEYGIEDAEILPLPARAETAWYADEGELWVLGPSKRKIGDIREIAVILCSGSASTDTTAELVYVGPGSNERFYQGKDLSGRIALVNGSPEAARVLAVEKHGAVGLVGYGSSHPEFDPDQIGPGSIRVGEKDKATFAFMVSTRQGQELRDMLERGQKVEIRAVAKTRRVPYKEEMVSALIRGKEYPEEELVFVAHMFEGVLKQGANDNMSGCAAILETARTLRALVSRGVVPPLKRSVRFLFVPEISGTAAYIRTHPEVARRFFANITHDMVGEGLIKTGSQFLLELPLKSRSSYLPDVVQSLVEWMGVAQSREGRGFLHPVIAPTGSRDPFLYHVVPFVGGSDHVVFNDGGVGVPSVLFNVWPDMWYHTSGDTPDKSDATQLKRAAVISAAAAVFLAGAGQAETEVMIREISSRGLSRIGRERARAEKYFDGGEANNLGTAWKEAWNIVDQAFVREKEALESIRFFVRKDETSASSLRAKDKGLEEMRAAAQREMEEIYKNRCLREKVRPEKAIRLPDEDRLDRLIPVRTEKMKGIFDSREFQAARRERKDLPAYSLGRAEAEARNFIDGKRSILAIRNAVSAEFAPVALKEVENLILVLEKTGYITLKKR